MGKNVQTLVKISSFFVLIHRIIRKWFVGFINTTKSLNRPVISNKYLDVGCKCLACDFDFLSPFSNSTLFVWNTVHWCSMLAFSYMFTGKTVRQWFTQLQL